MGETEVSIKTLQSCSTWTRGSRSPRSSPMARSPLVTRSSSGQVVPLSPQRVWWGYTMQTASVQSRSPRTGRVAGDMCCSFWLGEPRRELSDTTGQHCVLCPVRDVADLAQVCVRGRTWEPAHCGRCSCPWAQESRENKTLCLLQGPAPHWQS